MTKEISVLICDTYIPYSWQSNDGDHH